MSNYQDAAKRIALSGAEDILKGLTTEVLQPMIQEKIDANPSVAPILTPLLNEFIALTLTQVDKLDGEVG